MGWLFYEELFFMLAFAGYIVASIAFFVLLVSSKEKVGKFAVAATSVGFALHTVAMFVRIIESGRLPFSNQYEFANSFTWVLFFVTWPSTSTIASLLLAPSLCPWHF